MLSPWRTWGNFIFAGHLEVMTYSIGILLFLLCGWFFIKIRSNDKRQLCFSLPDLLVGGIMGWLFLSAVNRPVHADIVIGWMGLLLFYITIRNIPGTLLPFFFCVFPVAMIWQLVYGIEAQTDYFMPGKGLELICGTFTNTAIWAQFVAIAVIVFTGIILYRHSPILWTTAIILFIVGCFLLIVADSRAAWLSTTVGIGYLVIHRFWEKIKSIGYKKRCFIVIITGVLCLITIRELYVYKINSANGRLFIWETTGKMIQDRPLTGFGTDGFRKNYMLYQEDYFRMNPNSEYTNLAANNPFAFNEFLSTSVEYGIPALCFVLFFLYIIIKKTNKSPSPLTNWILLVSKASVWSFIIFGFFSYPLNVWQLSVVFFLFLAILASTHPPVMKIRRANLTTAVFLVASIIIYFTSVIPYSSVCREWNQALIDRIPADSCLNILEKTRPTMERHPAFLQSYGKRLNQAGQYARAAEVLESGLKLYPTYTAAIELGKSYEGTENYKQAEKIWTRAFHMVPGKFTPLYLRMKMHWKYGDKTKAEQLADSILLKEIKVYSPELNKIRRETKQIKNNKLITVSE